MNRAKKDGDNCYCHITRARGMTKDVFMWISLSTLFTYRNKSEKEAEMRLQHFYVHIVDQSEPMLIQKGEPVIRWDLLRANLLAVVGRLSLN